MKLKDIKTGMEYADTYGDKVVVLEVGIYGRVYQDRVGNSRSSHRHYVQVRTRYDHEEAVHFRSIVRPWADQEEIDKKIAAKKDKGEAEVARLWSILEKHTGLTRRDHWPSTRIELNHGEVTRLCEALERLGQPKVQSTN
ncbi:MAG: hypothetical protein K940chlam2_01414 [Chlamydiae bacterium]|nr:hypothetical protein [Chlamydiota bacterium]